jgi:predicted PurR-regulated permease PerM
MFEDLKKEFSSFKFLTILLSIAVLIYLAQFVWGFLGIFSDIIITVVFAWLLSFILEPVVNAISKLTRLAKPISALLTFGLLIAAFVIIIILFVPAITFQFEALSRVIPQFLEDAPSYVRRWNTYLVSSMDTAINYVPSVANFLFSALIAVILSFYFIIDGDRIYREFTALTPQRWHKNIKTIHGIINSTFASFIRVQFLFGVVYGVVVWVVLQVMFIDFAASTALLSGVLAMIPMIGPIFGILPPLFISFIVDPFKALIVFIILLIAQQLIFNIWGPRFLGKTFRIHPIIVLLSFVLGMRIGGIMGGILGIPVIGVIVIIIRDLGHIFIGSEKTD